MTEKREEPDLRLVGPTPPDEQQPAPDDGGADQKGSPEKTPELPAVVILTLQPDGQGVHVNPGPFPGVTRVATPHDVRNMCNEVLSQLDAARVVQTLQHQLVVEAAQPRVVMPGANNGHDPQLGSSLMGYIRSLGRRR